MVLISSITGLWEIFCHLAKKRLWICSFSCRSVSWSFFDKESESEATQAHKLHNWRWNGKLSNLQFLLQHEGLAILTIITSNWFDKDYSTKFAPWLAFGCLSPRKIFEKIREYEKEKVVPWQVARWESLEILLGNVSSGSSGINLCIWQGYRTESPGSFNTWVSSKQEFSSQASSSVPTHSSQCAFMCRITAGTGIVSCQCLPETCKSVCTLFEPDFPKNWNGKFGRCGNNRSSAAHIWTKGAAEAESWPRIQQDETAGIGVRVSQCLPETCKIKLQLVWARFPYQWETW